MNVVTYYVFVNQARRIMEILDEAKPIIQTAQAALTLNSMFHDSFSRNILVEKLKETRELLVDATQRLGETAKLMANDDSVDGMLMNSINYAYTKSSENVSELDSILFALTA